MAGGQAVREGEEGGQLREVGEWLDDPHGQTDIQLKYYLEFRKIYFTAFKLAAEVKKQTRLRDALLAKAQLI